jgi:hypothetical protein
MQSDIRSFSSVPFFVSKHFIKSVLFARFYLSTTCIFATRRARACEIRLWKCHLCYQVRVRRIMVKGLPDYWSSPGYYMAYSLLNCSCPPEKEGNIKLYSLHTVCIVSLLQRIFKDEVFKAIAPELPKARPVFLWYLAWFPIHSSRTKQAFLSILHRQLFTLLIHSL